MLSTLFSDRRYRHLFAAQIIALTGTSLVLTPTGQLLSQSCHEQDRPAVFSAQFSLSHACWLFAYPLAGALGAQVGLGSAFLVLGVISLAARWWLPGPGLDMTRLPCGTSTRHRRMRTCIITTNTTSMRTKVGKARSRTRIRTGTRPCATDTYSSSMGITCTGPCDNVVYNG